MKKKECIKNYRRRREKHHHDIYIYTPLHRDPQHFSDPLNPKLHFFPFSFFFFPSPPRFPFRSTGSGSIAEFNSRTRARSYCIHRIREILGVVAVLIPLARAKYFDSSAIVSRMGDLPVELLLTTYRDSRRRVNGDTGTSWQDRCIPTVAL